MKRVGVVSALALVLAFAAMLIVPHGAAQAATYHPAWYLTSMKFTAGEALFPVMGSGVVGYYSPEGYPWRLIKDDKGYGNESPARIDVEDMTSNYVPSFIGYGARGTTYDGHYINPTGEKPSDQNPSVYWRRKAFTGSYSAWVAYEYWVYYVYNAWHWPYSNHEHDWEEYVVYFKNGSVQGLGLSQHVSGLIFWRWSDFYARGLTDGTHAKVYVDNGSHAFGSLDNPGLYLGPTINWNNSVTQGTIPVSVGYPLVWYIFSNDPSAVGNANFDKHGAAQPPPYKLPPTNNYYQDDPWLGPGTNEYANPMQAPWIRPEFENPPLPPWGP